MIAMSVVAEINTRFWMKNRRMLRKKKGSLLTKTIFILSNSYLFRICTEPSYERKLNPGINAISEYFQPSKAFVSGFIGSNHRAWQRIAFRPQEINNFSVSPPNLRKAITRIILHMSNKNRYDNKYNKSRSLTWT